MGSAASKASRAAGGQAARKYPSRPSPATQTGPSPPPAQSTTQQTDLGPKVHSNQGARGSRDRTIDLDASDPVLASKLRKIGPVEANPYQSHTSSKSQYARQSPKALPSELAPLGNEPPPGLFPDAASMRNNPALLILQARKRLQEQAEYELNNLGRSGFEGREMIDVHMITDALRLRKAGMNLADIEKRMGLKRGMMAKLGERGVLEAGYA